MESNTENEKQQTINEPTEQPKKNFKEIYNKLDDSKYLKLKPNSKTLVYFLDDGSAVYTKKFTDKDVQMVDFKVQVSENDVDVEKVWSMSVGGKTSLYGQIMCVAAKKNALKGETLTMMRQGDTKDTTRYTIVEAVD